MGAKASFTSPRGASLSWGRARARLADSVPRRALSNNRSNDRSGNVNLTRGRRGCQATEIVAGYTIKKRGGDRDWMVIDPQGQLVCLTVYKRGAEEVVRRLAA